MRMSRTWKFPFLWNFFPFALDKRVAKQITYDFRSTVVIPAIDVQIIIVNA